MNEDINQEILAELRRVRSIGRRVCYLLLLLVILSVLAYPSYRHSQPASQTVSWQSVDTAMKEQEFPKALAEAQTLIARQPNYCYGHTYLGVIYLAMGDLTNAEIHYLRSYELFPIEEGKKDLAAVRKRLAEQQPMRMLSK